MNGPDFCYSCGRDEPIPPSGVYLICLECGHAYVTAQDLVDAYHSESERIYVAPLVPLAADAIYHCPLCMHDF